MWIIFKNDRATWSRPCKKKNEARRENNLRKNGGSIELKVFMSSRKLSWSEVVVREQIVRIECCTRGRFQWTPGLGCQTSPVPLSLCIKLGLSPCVALRWWGGPPTDEVGWWEIIIKVQGNVGSRLILLRSQEPRGLRRLWLGQTVGTGASCHLRFNFSDLPSLPGIYFLKERMWLGWFGQYPNQGLLYQIFSESGSPLCRGSL